MPLVSGRTRFFAAVLLLPAAAALAACAPSPAYRPRPKAAAADASPVQPTDTALPPIALTPPVEGFHCERITSRFGAPRSGGAGGHEGIDIDAETGEEVHAAAPGAVIFSGSRRGYGNLVIVEHEGGFSTFYGHLTYATVRRGESVGAGSLLGRAGKRGRATGAHLHFELRFEGRAVDPAPYLCLDSPRDSP